MKYSLKNAVKVGMGIAIGYRIGISLCNIVSDVAQRVATFMDMWSENDFSKDSYDKVREEWKNSAKQEHKHIIIEGFK